MRCPFCGAIDTRVVDSRLVGDSDQVRRRRECNDCEERFTTYETAELNLPRVIKSRGNREPFSENKLQSGFQKALQKRPVSVDAIDRAVGRVRHRCLIAGEREIDAQRIGGWVMDELKQLDEVAYIRFASVYRHFEDAAAFRAALDTLQRVEPSLKVDANQLSLLEETDDRSAKGRPAERGPTERGPTERGPTERGPTERGTDEAHRAESAPADDGVDVPVTPPADQPSRKRSGKR